MPVPIYDYRIGAGWNLPLGSLTNVELIQPPGERYIYPPASYGTYDPGAPYLQDNGILKFRGYPSLSWDWRGNPGGYITYGQANHLRVLICGSLDFSGTATIYTPTLTPHVYARFNTIAQFQKFNESAPNFKIFTRFGIRMIHLVGL